VRVCDVCNGPGKTKLTVAARIALDAELNELRPQVVN
jgi:hypothetical protein